MNNKFSEFIHLAFNKRLQDRLDYKLIRESEWKNTYLLLIQDSQFIVQIRKKVGFYEHVVEALKVWNKNKCNVSQLIYFEDNEKYMAYVFPYIKGVIAKDIIFVEDNILSNKELLFNIGKKIRELCTENTNGFGWLVDSFTGQFNSWYEYLNNIVVGNINKIRDISSKADIDSILALLNKNKEKLMHINPKLLYVDINLGNIIVNNNDIWIIDYDYLISGDELWIVALFEVLYDQLAEKNHFTNGFLFNDEIVDKELLTLYKILHLIQLTSSKNVDKQEIYRREKLLLKIIKDI